MVFRFKDKAYTLRSLKNSDRFRTFSFFCAALLCALFVFWALVFTDSPTSTAEDSLEDEVPTESILETDANNIDTGQISDSSFLYDTAIGDLASADMYYDDLTVQITGEAVGEAIKVTGDPEHRWVTLSDPKSGSSIVTYMRKADAEQIDMYGSYGKTGSTVKVQGTFHLICQDHNGESDLHVTNMRVVAPGSESPDVFNARSFVPGVAVLGLGFALALYFYHKREKSR